MNHRLLHRTFLLGPISCTLLSVTAFAAGSSWQLGDKTLVAWVSPANTTQRGGSVLTLQNVPGQFDAIVLGELEPGRWMVGSEFFRRTSHDQKSWPVESAAPGKLVQIAATYRGKEVSLSRDGQTYAHYTMETDPAKFDQASVALLGLRHLEVAGGAKFVGEIADARIYPIALTAAALGSLRPDQPGGPRPLAWW